MSVSEELDRLGRKIVDAAYTVHKALGPGLLESVYEKCLCHELNKRGLRFERQVAVPFMYDGIQLDRGLVLDVLVERQIVCELKAQEHNPVFVSQLLSQLKLANLKLGYLINFHVPLLKQGIRRLVL